MSYQAYLIIKGNLLHNYLSIKKQKFIAHQFLWSIIINYSSIFMGHNNALETYEPRGFCPCR
jgi:hypothetical protein